MTDDDIKLFVELARDTERLVATLSQAERARAISSLILEANIAYGVWREGIAFGSCDVSSRPAMTRRSPAYRSSMRRTPIC